MSKNLRLVPVPNEALIAQQLTEQYQRAISGLWEVVKFGAMFEQVRKVLGTCAQNSGPKRGPGSTENSFGAWLEANCPKINRRNAYRFMAIAVGLRSELNVPQKVDLVALLTCDHAELEPRLLKYRSRIAEFLEGKSQRQLLLALGQGDSGTTRDPGGDQQLQKFLRERFPEYASTKLAKLPEHVAKAWREFLEAEARARQGGLSTDEYLAKEIWEGLLEKLRGEIRAKKFLFLPLPVLKEIDAYLKDLRTEIKAAITQG